MIRFSCRLVAWLVGLFALAVLFAAPGARAEANDALGPGDSIRITVYGNPDLTTETRLAARGTVRMPLVGDVEIAGTTASEAAARIAARLKKGQFLKDPQVTVNVLQVRSRQVSVLGEVLHPGRYVLEDHARLTDALALAGGISPSGGNTVAVMAGHGPGAVKQVVNLSRMYRNADASANIELHNGDTVYVERAPVFYIYGEVQHAGAYRLDGDLNVMQAISLGGGITPRGTERGLSIRRRMPNGGVEQIDVKPADRVKPDDVIYVKESLF
ncbi:MAG TPA: polysaccharide export protein EpsE [Rhodocyclaceae bacterium]